MQDFDRERLESVIEAVNRLSDERLTRPSSDEFDPSPVLERLAGLQKAVDGLTGLRKRVAELEAADAVGALIERVSSIEKFYGTVPHHNHDQHTHQDSAHRSHGHESTDAKIALLDKAVGDQGRTSTQIQADAQGVVSLLEAEASATRGLLRAHEQAPHAWAGHQHADLLEAIAGLTTVLETVDKRLLQIEENRLADARQRRTIETGIVVEVNRLAALVTAEIARLEARPYPEHTHEIDAEAGSTRHVHEWRLREVGQQDDRPLRRAIYDCVVPGCGGKFAQELP